MKNHTWLVVTNKEKAKIYRIVKVGKFEEVASFVHPDMGKKGIDYQEDRLGRAYDRMGGGRHAMEPETTIEDKKCIAFARILNDFLKAAYDRGDFEHLFIACEARFLGYLRSNLKRELLETIEETVNKDLVGRKPQDVWDHLGITV